MKVAVFGAGIMGSGIAQVFAEHGHEVLLFASSPASAQRHKDKLAAFLEGRVAKGKADAADVAATLERIKVVEEEGAADVDLVVEAVNENMAYKKQFWARVDSIVGPQAVFASNTSSLSITEMAAGLTHQLVGMHFFNPAPLMPLIEVIRGANTSDEAFNFIYQLSKDLGKDPVEVAESPAFVVNRMLVPMINEATHLLEMGVASAEDIDKAMRLGASHKIGPLALGDLIGLDVVLAVMETIQKETGDQKYAPTLLLRKMVRSGKLGRKTGEGFFKY